ncbi:hypothetical protein [Mucilaginibacter sp.]
MKKLILGVCLCTGMAACHSNNKPKDANADSPMMTGKADQAGTVNDSSHTAANADSQKVGKSGGAPTDTTSTGSGKLDK